jgi:hypothetical protein
MLLCAAGMASTSLLPAITSHQVACKLLLTGDLVSAQVGKGSPIKHEVIGSSFAARMNCSIDSCEALGKVRVCVRVADAVTCNLSMQDCM